MSADTVTAVIGGAAFANWTAYEVDSDVLTPADAFSLEVAAPSQAQIEAVTEGAAITLMVGSSPVLTGWVDEKRLRITRDGTTLTITGRDATAPLADCSVPLSWTRRNVTLAQLVSQALLELGITAAVSAHADAQKPIAFVKPEPGETFWELLDREARRARLMIWSGPDGIHVDRPDYTSPAIASLVHDTATASRSRTNLLELEVTWRTAGRRTPVTVVGQSQGSDSLFGGSAQKITATATDPELEALGLKRPLVITDAGATSSTKALARAQWEVSRRKGEALVFAGVVWGHGPSADSVWTPNTVVSVQDSVSGIGQDLWIAARRLTRSRTSGTRTSLTLRTLGAILPAVAS